MVRDTKRFKSGFDSFENEIGFHIHSWLKDPRYKKLHKFIRDGVEFLDRQARIAESSMESDGQVRGKDADSVSGGAKRFISVYKSRYLELTDRECPENPSPATFCIIKDLVRKMNEDGTGVDEYLRWFFEKIDSSKGMAPSYGAAVSGSFYAQFIYSNAEELKERRNTLANNKMMHKAVFASKIVYDATRDEVLLEMYEKLKAGRCHSQILYEKAMEIAKREGILGTIEQQVKVEMEPLNKVDDGEPKKGE